MSCADERDIDQTEKAAAAVDDNLEPQLDERIELVTFDVRGIRGRARRR
jgi:hypothetical protein